MKSLMKISSLVILLFGLLVAWPAPVARGDGDGVGILPHFQDDGRDEPESRIDGGGNVHRHELYAATYGFLMVKTPDGQQTTFVFPPRPTPFSWRVLATLIANNRGYRGLKFTVGYVAVDGGGQTTYVLTAQVDGGSHKAPVMRVQRY